MHEITAVLSIPATDAGSGSGPVSVISLLHNPWQKFKVDFL
jgi:hypothetical protein